ncbi:calmodulin-binding transcription activator 1 isoform X3 [Raphanus sativus]|nr:calmodulin-binding transcription activator 1 isoform X3 [Raphanus sativus]XP_018446095.1 calmodulin-binding transcription activator 1 isoform X3 [Raphanus sativus]XP_056846354.1 calmodulin-binding transcription activator 1 isoform X3 [Raphanus sativus]XP_056846355.1 calmodulin-binding transcription activator 1 isoform X3 [Raphanus sativus]
MEQLLSEAQHRWLRPAEICEILRNYHKFHIATESPTRPASGSLFLFDRKVLRYFRKDGHNWRKKKDGKTIKEAHEKLKVGSIDVLHCYYAHGEGNENFQRRCYWMLEQELMHIVFVHYLEVKGSRTSIGMKENNSNSLSGSVSVNIDSAASPTSRLSSYCEDADSGDSHQSSSVLQASPEPQTGNHNGWTSAPGMRSDSQRLFDVQAWDAVGNLVTRYDQPCNNLLVEERTDKGGMLAAEHLRSPLQTQLNWQIPAQDDLPLPKWHLAPHSGMADDTDLALFEQSAQDNFESFSSLLDIEHLQSDGIPPSNMETEFIPVKKSLLRHEDSLKKVDSFSRWASKELGEMEDLQMQSSRGDIAWTTVDCETAAAGLAFSPSLSEDQRFTIVDYWPKCAQTDAEVEVLVIGTFLLSPQEVTICSWSCMFGEVEVPAEILVDGVLCCHAPPHTAGQVPFYVTCSNRFACSELREFEFLSGSTKKIDAADIYGYSSKETSLQLRFEKLLAHRDFVQEHQIFEDVVEKRRKISSIMLLNEEKEYLFPGMYERDSTKQEPKERVFREQFEDELYIWLIHKVTEGGKGPNLLDEGGQGVLHFVAALGYDWAIKPILAAGVNINFRDSNGWSALHWAAFSGREETVAVLVSLGADAGALTDPSPELPLGKTAADLAYGKEHRGISGFLAESSLTSYLEKLTMVSKENSPANSSGSKAVQTVSERTAAPMSYGDVPEKLSMKDSLTAVRNATQAANRLHQVFRMQSFQRKQLSGFDDDDDELGISNELAVSFAASKTKNPGQSEVFAHSAATHIQKKYRGWKKRKEFLLIRQRVVKIQAHVRGHQVRKQYKPIVWSVGLLEKIILRWRRKGTGLRGFKRNVVPKTVEPEPLSPMIPKEDDYDFLEKGRKQTEERLQKALTRVKSMVQYPEARDQYRRLLTVVEGFRENEASSSLSINNREEGLVNCEEDDLIDIESILNDDILMSTSP